MTVFQGASEAPVCESYGLSEQSGKTATGPGPQGCDQNGLAAALLVGHVFDNRHGKSERHNRKNWCGMLPPRLAGGPF